jgi:hypothetical protein
VAVLAEFFVGLLPPLSSPGASAFLTSLLEDESVVIVGDAPTAASTSNANLEDDPFDLVLLPSTSLLNDPLLGCAFSIVASFSSAGDTGFFVKGNIAKLASE